MDRKKANSNPLEIKLGVEGKRENNFSIACFGIFNGSGIPIERYKEIREQAKTKAMTHPDWPAGAEPSDEVEWNGTTRLFTIKPLQIGAA